MELISLLTSYDYPGNVRELHGMVYDAVSLNKTPVLSMDVFKERILNRPSSTSHSVPRGTVPRNGERLAFGAKLPTMEEVKDQLIAEALKRTGGNKTLAASLLGMSRQAITLRERRPGVVP
ncbi:MAG: hypothetical protein AMXMBFR84_22680 [Candidatus Hydrogenedentota bacterium]